MQAPGPLCWPLYLRDEASLGIGCTLKQYEEMKKWALLSFQKASNRIEGLTNSRRANTPKVIKTDQPPVLGLKHGWDDEYSEVP